MELSKIFQGLVLLWIDTMKVKVYYRQTRQKTWLINCVFLSAEGCNASSRRRGGRKKALSQAIKLNIELHSSSCLSMPLLLMLPPKQRIKGLECGVGKSQALSLPASDICKKVYAKKRERKRERERKLAWNVVECS